ncbi:hypothetical protein IWW50_004405, partial [Coemansia erecta]
MSFTKLPEDIIIDISSKVIDTTNDDPYIKFKQGLPLLSICCSWRYTILPVLFKTLFIVGDTEENARTIITTNIGGGYFDVEFMQFAKNMNIVLNSIEENPLRHLAPVLEHLAEYSEHFGKKVTLLDISINESSSEHELLANDDMCAAVDGGAEEQAERIAHLMPNIQSLGINGWLQTDTTRGFASHLS